MSLAIRVLIGLVTGFATGLAISGSSSPASGVVLAVATPVGEVFVNLIRASALPLVAALLVASVGGVTASSGFRRIGTRAVLISVALLTIAAIASMLIAVPVLTRIELDQEAVLAMRGAAGQAASEVAGVPAGAGLSAWFVSLVPANVVKAAADGAMLPVILAAVVFGIALARIDGAKREPVLRVVDGIAEALQRLVLWILELAPIGVFALAVPLASRLGLAALGAVVAYIALVVVLTVAATVLLLYPVGILAGPMKASAFVSYCAPAQAIAFAARSSLAALPAMITSAERAGLPPTASRVVLPLSMALFHFGSAVAQTVGVVFLARLFGVELSPAQAASIVLAVVLATFAVPGIPGGSIIAMVPVLATAGLPMEGIGILLAVDTIPDMFRTTSNLTGAMTLTAILPPAEAPDASPRASVG